AEEDRPEAAGRPGRAGSTAPKHPLPTLRDQSVASRWHQPCGKPFPLPLTQTWIDRRNQPGTRHIQDHRRKKMTNLLINPALWNLPRFNELAGSGVAGPAPHVFLPSLSTALARRKQSTPTGTPQETAIWVSTARISLGVSPLRSAPRTWVWNSSIFPSEAIMPRLRIERSRGVNVSSPQASPQQYWVTKRWKSRLKSSALLSARST